MLNFGSIASFVKKFGFLKLVGRRRTVVSTAPEQFEERVVPAAISVVGVDTTPMIVGAYDDINAHQFSVDTRATSTMTGVIVTPVDGATFDGVFSGDLMGDPGHDGFYEKVIGTAQPVNGRLVFTTHESVDRKVDGDFQILLHLDPYVPGEFIGVHIEEVSFENKRGKDIKPSKIGYTNVDGTAFTITDADVAVSLVPSADTVNAGGQISYTLGVMNFGTTTEVLAHQFLSVPEGFVFDPVASSPELYQYPDFPHQVYWDLENLSAGEDETVTAVFTVSTAVAGPQEVYASTYVNHRERADNNNSFTVTTNVTAATNVVSFSIDGPVAGTFSNYENNIVLATLSIDTTDGAVDMSNAFFAIEGRHADNSLITNVDTLTEGMYLRNSVTGNMIGTSVVQAYNGLQIYKASDFVVDDGDVFQLIGRMNGPMLHGDMFRVHFVVEPSSSSTQVNIGGLTGVTTDYRLQAVDLSSGNIVDVHPGGVINGNFQTVEAAQLFVAQKSIGTTKVAVKNEKNVSLLQFEAYTSTSQDVLLTEVVFEAKSGSLLNASRYLLVVDTDGDYIGDTIVDEAVAQIGQVRFNTLAGGGYVNPALQTVHYEVRADIASSLTNDTLQLKFETAFDGIQAETVSTGAPLFGLDVNGSSPNSQIHLSISTDSVLVQLKNKGTIAIPPAGQVDQERLVLAGSLTPSLVTFEVRAQYEAADLTRFQILVTGEGVTAIDRFNIYKIGEVTPFATATIAATGSDPVESFGTTFTARTLNGQAIVGDGMSQVFYVRAVLRADTEGAVAGSEFQVAIPPLSIEARGVASSNELLSGPTSFIIGSRNTVTTAMPVNVTNRDPNANGTSVPTGVSVIGSFSIDVAAHVNSADGLDKVVMHDFVFEVTTANVAIDPTSYYIFNMSDSSEIYAATEVVNTPTGVFLIFADAFEHINATISSGQQQSYAVRANITNAKVLNTQTSTLQLKLLADESTWAAQDANTDEVFVGLYLEDEYGSTIFNS